MIVNGSKAGKFELRCSMRQECPLAPFLFAMVIEPLLPNLRSLQERGTLEIHLWMERSSDRGWHLSQSCPGFYLALDPVLSASEHLATMKQCHFSFRGHPSPEISLWDPKYLTRELDMVKTMKCKGSDIFKTTLKRIIDKLKESS